MVYTTNLRYVGGCFIIVIPTLHQIDSRNYYISSYYSLIDFHPMDSTNIGPQTQVAIAL